MNRQALFSDGTADYVCPPEPAAGDKVTIRLRTAQNDIDEAVIVSGNERIPMVKKETRGEFDYYFAEKLLGKQLFRYHFEIKSQNETCYYNRCGAFDEIVDVYAFAIAPGFSTGQKAQ